METDFIRLIHQHWNMDQLRVNFYLLLNLLGALMLGMLVGYERSFHGRAAGMRTYGLVCMASAALTSFHGYVPFWFGGSIAHINSIDPTRVIQGIVTGIGFLGAGVIMKEGLSISGLTTAASIWASCAIGVLVGMGFYATASMLSALSTAVMVFIPKLEDRLPTRRAIGITLEFKEGRAPSTQEVRKIFVSWGYRLTEGSLQIDKQEERVQWTFVLVATSSTPELYSLFELGHRLNDLPHCTGFHLAHARN